MSERIFICVEAKAGGLGKRQAAGRPRRPVAAGAALAVTALLAARGAQAAGDGKYITLAPPSANSEHTVVHVGPLALKVRTSSIVLGAADGAGGVASFAPNVSSFAQARETGVYTVAGSAKAALTLSFDVGDFLEHAAGRIPLPLGGVGRQLQAALSLEAGGKLSLNVGSSFGFSSSSRDVPDQPGGHFSFSVNALKPWKHVGLRWRYTFY